MDTDRLIWRKSSFSSNGAECVEVAFGPDGQRVHVRDTKSRERGHLTVDSSAWREFLTRVCRDGR